MDVTLGNHVRMIGIIVCILELLNFAQELSSNELLFSYESSMALFHKQTFSY